MASELGMIENLSIRDEGHDSMDTAYSDPPLRADIEVCGATDCLVMGSGAAILEIEELADEFGHATGGRIHVQRSGCLGLCGRGPAVKLCLHGEGVAVLPRIFTEVDGPQRCAEIIAVVPGAPAIGDGDGTEAQLMARRAAGLRWDALKALSRRTPGTLAPPTILDAAIVADRQMARSPTALARAERRATRLLAAAPRPTLVALPSPFDSAGL